MPALYRATYKLLRYLQTATDKLISTMTSATTQTTTQATIQVKTPTTVNVDIAIIGGGIAGLWLLNRLCNQGYNAVLLQQGKLGAGQTIASQGMIHGGIKYALGGALSGASEAIADMPDHWRRCLQGKGDVDLREASVLSEHFYMWSTQSLTSKVSSFFASKLSRGRVNKVSRKQRPPVFQSNDFNGNLYQLVDLVLDVPSVIKALADNYAQRIFSIDWAYSQFQQAGDGAVESLLINNAAGDTPIKLLAQRTVLSAGEGNEVLCAQLGISQPAMQRRPLKQVIVKHHYDYALYAHCMGANPSPRLTVSSHRCQDGGYVWYLGGDLATEGVKLDDQALIAKAQSELKALFPWLDFSQSQFATLAIDRAEPKQSGLLKPDQAFAQTAKNCRNVIVGWPTKLTLSPNMSDAVCDILDLENITASNTEIDPALSALPRPGISPAHWDTIFS